MAESEPRYTREEWEAIWIEEERESARRAKERGDLWGSVVVSGEEIRRQSREQLEALIDAKLAQLRLYMLSHLGERDAGR